MNSSPAPEVALEAARLAPLFAALEADAPRHDFYQVLRQVDAAVSAPLGRAARPADEPLRLTQQASLVFAPASLSHCEVDAAGHHRLAVLNFGLFGPNGAMPLHLSEYLEERQQHHHDHTLARFCDLFQHRMILLFYRAWADCQAAPSLDRPGRDTFGRFVASLAGLGQPTLRNRDSLPDHHKLLHVGHLASRSRHPQGLCAPLSALLPDPDDLAKALRPPLVKVFPAALLGRLQVIPYYPLSDDMLGNIVRLQLGRIQRRIATNHQAEFSYTDAVVALIASRCSEPESGGRMIDAILTNTILPRLSEEILLRLKDGQGVKRMALDVADGDFSYAYA